MAPVPMSDGSSMPPMGHASPYDNAFAVKPATGGPGVLRPLPPHMQSQQPSFSSQQPIISSPVPIQHQQSQSNPVMPMRTMDGKLNFEI